MVKFLISLPIFIIIALVVSHFMFSANAKTIFAILEDIPFQTYKTALILSGPLGSDDELSPEALTQAEAAIRLYEQNKISSIYITGDNRVDGRVSLLAAYITSQGVPRKIVAIDKLGIDLHDSCRHLYEYLELNSTEKENLLESNTIIVGLQHQLPQTLLMCRDEELSVDAVAIEQLSFAEFTPKSAISNVAEGVNRYLGNSILTWAYRFGAYDFMSIEAEKIENNQLTAVQY